MPYKVIKVILAIIFLLCLLKMPYGYYELVRFLALVGFALLAYNAYQNNNTVSIIIYVALAVLFQPFIKIALGRSIWNVMDVIVAIGLLVSIFIKSNAKTRKSNIDR